MTIAEAIDAARREYVANTLNEARGDVRKAAAVAGVTKSSFYRLIHRYYPQRISMRKRGNWFGLEA